MTETSDRHRSTQKLEETNAEMAQLQTWQTWIRAVYTASDGKINYWNPLLDEAVAKTEHPNLYHDYRSGVAPEEFAALHLVHYDELEAGGLEGTTAQIDPDEEEIPDQEY